MKRRDFVRRAAGLTAAAVALPLLTATKPHPYPFTEWLVMSPTGPRVLMRHRWGEEWYDLIELRPDGTEVPYGGFSSHWLADHGTTPEEELRIFAGLHVGDVIPLRR